jgi:hypothetical protein
MNKERERANLPRLESKVTKRTVGFVERLVENRGEADFELLSSEVVEELKKNFPELAKRLRVAIK